MSLAVGAGAMMFLASEETSSATSNTAIGYGALATIISNSYNTAVGSQAGFMLQGDGNTFIGASSGSFGGASNNNTAIGARSLGMTMDASNNTAIGYMALGGFFSNGANNTALGYQAGADIETGGQNIAIGYYPTLGVGVTSGSGNILIGNDVRPQSQTASNQLNIGNLIYGTGLGSGATASTGSVGIGTASPVATLDVAGAIHLAPRTSAPIACSAATKGSIAYASTAKRLCVCNGTSWIFDYNGAACTW